LYYLSLVHDYFHRLDITVCLLLAAGYSGPNAISYYVADYAPVQVARHSSRRRIRSFKIDHNAARKIDKKDMKNSVSQ
jgi:hypothetical protein